MLRCFQRMMITFYNTYYSVDDRGKTPTAFSALFQHAEHHGRHNKAPGIFIQQIGDDLLDFLLGDDIAVTYKHLMRAKKQKGPSDTKAPPGHR